MKFVRPKASFTRPADTTQYAVGDLVANSTTAGSVVPMNFVMSEGGMRPGLIRRVRLRATGTSLTAASFRLHLYAALPTPSNGDNGAWLTNLAANYVSSIDITATQVFTDGMSGNGVPNTGLEIMFGSIVYYGLLEARDVYTPISAEVFSVELETMEL